MKSVFTIIFVVLVLLAAGVYLYIYKSQEISSYIGSQINIMTTSSTVFENDKFIPPAFTCDGADVNPSIDIHDAPKNTKSFALIVTDPDAANGTFTHWIVWNIDPKTTEIPQQGIPEGAVEGINGSGNRGYMGPCPPSGTHHYIFTLYALDTVLSLDPASSRSKLEEAMIGHIIDTATLTGLYGRIK